MIVCAAVIGQQVMPPAHAARGRVPMSECASLQLQNQPLYLRALLPTEDEIKFHYIVHCSLDAIEEKVLLRRAPNEVPERYLGLLYPTEQYRVYGYITNTHVKFVLVLDEFMPSDDELQRVFKALHQLYVDTTFNPLYTYGLPLTSPNFHKGVLAAVQQYVPQQ